MFSTVTGPNDRSRINLALSILVICLVFIALCSWYYQLFQTLETTSAMADARPTETTTCRPLRDTAHKLIKDCSHAAQKLKRKVSNINVKSNEDANAVPKNELDDELDEFCCLGRNVIRLRRGCRRQRLRIRQLQGRNHGIWPEALNSRPTFGQWCRVYMFDQILLGAISLGCLAVRYRNKLSLRY